MQSSRANPNNPQPTAPMKSDKWLVIGITAVIVGFALGYFVTYVPIVSGSWIYGVPFQTQTVITQTQTTMATSTAFSWQSITVNPGNWYYQSSEFQIGQAVFATWTAEATVNVYLFSSSQYSAYNSSNRGTTTAVASQTNAQSGTIGFTASFPDTYYLVIYNPHTGNITGQGKESVEIFSASVMAIYPQVTVSVNTSNYTTITTLTSSCVQPIIVYATEGNSMCMPHT